MNRICRMQIYVLDVEGIILLIPEPDIQNKGNEKVEWIGKGIGKELEKRKREGF